MPPEVARPAHQPARFLFLYALAWAGGSVAYVPFLTLLLPMRVADMAGPTKVEWLASITFVGAISASLSAILWGWLSDRARRRRPFVAAGLIGTITLMLCVPLAHGMLPMLLLVVAWQLTLNLMLAPLSAWAADHVAGGQLGLLGGMLAFAPAIGSLAGTLITAPGLAGPDARLWFVAALVAGCVSPALIAARPIAGAVEASAGATMVSSSLVTSARPLAVMIVARLMVQVAEAALFAYLYFYFRSIDPTNDEASIARLFGTVLCIAVPVALLVGRWSDRANRPIAPLVAFSLLSASGLVAMGLARTPTAATAGYVLFGLTTAVFLSLHSGQVLRHLPKPAHRGRDLGILNLSNTVPSLIMPWLTLAMVPSFGFGGLFLLLAALALGAAILLAAVPRIARRDRVLAIRSTGGQVHGDNVHIGVGEQV